MKKFVLTVFISFCASHAMAWEITSNGKSQMNTLNSKGRKILWIDGDTARDIYEALKQEPSYFEFDYTFGGEPVKAVATSKELKKSPWLCISFRTEAGVKDNSALYKCRTILVEGQP